MGMYLVVMSSEIVILIKYCVRLLFIQFEKNSRLADRLTGKESASNVGSNEGFNLDQEDPGGRAWLPPIILAWKIS